ncbi:MAG: ATP-dependent helicase [Puniceicoccales bacterium]|jgi:DNA helicase-2/ATP-dependent DNA helicase PcrA|nr:ATP-dependent helicase [Puniceicoccales bacterium]
MQTLSGMPPIDFAAALNEDQFRAVTAGEGPALVLAGAGSGKTRTLTYRVAWLLAQGVRPWEILLLTFTNKAAKEMLSRVEDLTGIVRSHFWGGTFHSIGQRILRTHAPLIELDKNFTILDSSDSESLFNEVAKAHDPVFVKDKNNPKPRVILDALSYARNTRRPCDEIFEARFGHLPDDSLAKFPEFAVAYRAEKRKRAVCDYDDLLELWLELLTTQTEVRELYQRRFKHILVDEFQDTNKLQGEIVDTLAAQHQVMAVGDDAQCIYTWRGAEFANIADFGTRHPGTAIHKIEINYRSTPEILDFANGILAHQDVGAGFSKTLRPVRQSGLRPFLVPTMDTTEQAQFVIKCVRGMVERGRDLGDITVLYRAHYQAMELQLELTRNGIPFVITSGVRFFEQAHIRDFVAQLRFIHNPSDTVAFSRVMALLPKVGPKTAERILDLGRKEAARRGIPLLEGLGAEKVIEKVPEPARGDFRDLVLTMQDMDEALHGKPTAPTKTTAPIENYELAIDDGTGAKPTAPTLPTSTAPTAPSVVKTPAEVLRIGVEGWYGDFLRNIYPNWQDRREDLNSLLAFASKYDDVNELLAQLVLLNSESDSKSAEPDSDTLRLTTVHQAKGLEFPVVFILSCADEMFPLRRAIESGDVEEERRLFYVAATRAMEELYCVYPKITHSASGQPNLMAPSQFIAELPPHTYETVYLNRRHR